MFAGQRDGDYKGREGSEMDISSEEGGKINQELPTTSAICQLTVLTSRWDLVPKGYLKEAQRGTGKRLRRCFCFGFFSAGKEVVLTAQ